MVIMIILPCHCGGPPFSAVPSLGMRSLRRRLGRGSLAAVRRRPLIAAAALAAAIVTLLAGCGGSGSGADDAGGNPVPPADRTTALAPPPAPEPPAPSPSGAPSGTVDQTGAVDQSGPASTVGQSGPAAGQVSIVIIGDSYTSGAAQGGNGARNWTALAENALLAAGYPVDLTVLGLSGSGYVRIGSTGMTFGDGVDAVVDPQTQLVMIFGSVNDGISDPVSVADAARRALDRLAILAPAAEIVIVGPQWVDDTPPAGLLAIRDALSAAVTAADARFIDPLAAGWFSGAATAMIGDDGLHPTDTGHVYLADLLTPALAEAVADIISAGN
ncbi:MAG: SGNH/GDSL hydrolase family protein [Nakamurella sp.]